MNSPKQSVFFLALSAGIAFANDQPTGHLDVSSLLVRASSKVALDWKVNFPAPEDVEDIVDIDDVVLVDLNKASAAQGADYQDLVILMTFDKREVDA